MRFADDMVVCAAARDCCEDLVYCASEQLHELGLSINVAKVKYCSKEEFQRFWGFVIMDCFNAGNVEEGLHLLRKVIDEDMFGRRNTALKRAITVISKKPELGAWRTWVRNEVVERNLATQLSREQLLSLIRVYDDPLSALRQIIPVFLQQPFTQPKAILLRALEKFQNNPSAKVRTLCTNAIRDVAGLNDPVLSLGIKHARDAASGYLN